MYACCFTGDDKKYPPDNLLKKEKEMRIPEMHSFPACTRIAE
jgi:hypothetical protein